MKPRLFFDTETTGLPDWKKPSESDSQPHIVQIAAILTDEDTRKIISSIDLIIKPEGWVISPEMTEIHGITTEHALDVGVSEKLAVELFIELMGDALRVAHNTTFDNRIIRIALKRYMPDLIPDEVWKDRSTYHCTLMNARKIMGGKSGHTLEEAYKHFTGKDMENAHSAMPDTQACMEIYWAILDREKALAA